jgi:branched-subunit amino acid transport protein
MWAAILAGSAGCYLLKLLGLSVPERVLAGPRVRRIAEALPVGLLAALIATQTFATGHDLTVDARAVGLVAAVIAVWRRAPFLVVVGAAAATTALARAVG